MNSGGIEIGCNPVAGGTIWNWTHNDLQYVNNYDLGRQLQNWSFINGSRCPGEAGSGYVVDMTDFYRMNASVQALSYRVGNTIITPHHPC